MAHIALAVRDQERSRRFYEQWFGFDPETAWVAEDGTLLMDGPGDVSLALGEVDEVIVLPRFLHFGFRSAENPEEVRSFRDRLGEATGVTPVFGGAHPGRGKDDRDQLTLTQFA